MDDVTYVTSRSVVLLGNFRIPPPGDRATPAHVSHMVGVGTKKTPAVSLVIVVRGRGIFCLKLDKIPRVTLEKDLSKHYLELL